MSGPRFLFAVHNHQPVGNFADVLVRAFRDCYLPFLETVARHPRFRFSAHFSGPLWEFMQAREKGCWDLVAELARRGQMELLSGGFYEPVLAIIPEEDRLGQIRMMNDYLRENFGAAPRGLWLTERVWEPQLAKTLVRAGIAYTLLDEEHFLYAGADRPYASYVTEDEGRALSVFPIDKRLRYLIPFRGLDEVQAHFDAIQAAGGMAILGDDGEKFGLWPGTRRWVYDEGWLEKFLDFLEENEVQTSTFGEAHDDTVPAGRIYFPPASYEEMMEWVLEPEAQAALASLKATVPSEGRRFVRGGMFRDFCRKYPEANALHKRMIRVSRSVAAAGGDDARRALYRGQGNDPYWHGVFGGLYLPHLREAAYASLLEAEALSSVPAGWSETDGDSDGRPEIFRTGPTFGFVAKPDFGGALVEIDHRPWRRNLTDVLSRRREAYHAARTSDAAAGENGAGKSIHEASKTLPPEAHDLLRCDWHPRYCALDHIFHEATTREAVASLDFGEQGDFVNQPYRYRVSGEALFLERMGSVRAGPEPRPLVVRKTIFESGPRLTAEYEILNPAEAPLDLLFGSEWNFLAFPEEAAFEKDRALLYGRLEFRPRGAAELWSFPLRTLSQSEGGFDIIHQGYCLLPVWRIHLDGGARFRFSVEIGEIAHEE
jgi:alpha-amylase/alpha-mannosidase (GH57 family)